MTYSNCVPGQGDRDSSGSQILWAIGCNVWMDVAHFVAQKTEIGVTPKPPGKDEKDKQMAFYEKKCREFVDIVMSEIVQKEAS